MSEKITTDRDIKSLTIGEIIDLMGVSFPVMPKKDIMTHAETIKGCVIYDTQTLYVIDVMCHFVNNYYHGDVIKTEQKKIWKQELSAVMDNPDYIEEQIEGINEILKADRPDTKRLREKATRIIMWADEINLAKARAEERRIRISEENIRKDREEDTDDNTKNDNWVSASVEDMAKKYMINGVFSDIWKHKVSGEIVAIEHRINEPIMKYHAFSEYTGVAHCRTKKEAQAELKDYMDTSEQRADEEAEAERQAEGGAEERMFCRG